MKNKGLKRLASMSCLVLAVGAMSCAARADIKYTQVNSMPSGEAGTLKPMMTMTTFTRAGQQRMDSSMQIASFKQSETTVTTCAKHQKVRWDAALKIYALDTLDKNGHVVQPTPTPISNAPSQPAKHDTGKIVSTINVKSLGTEMIAARKARHYLLTTDMQEYGCAGKDHIRTKQEIWVADVDIPTFDCGLRNDVATISQVHFKDDCDCTFEQKGDIAAFATAFKGVIVKMKMFDGDTEKVIMAQETTMISQAKLTDADFLVPADFKLLSDKDYEKARSQAMMKAMMGSAMSGMADAANADANSDNANGGNTTQNSAPNNSDNSGDGSVVEDMGKDAVIGKIRKHFPGF